MLSPEELNDRFASETVQFEIANGGLTRCSIENRFAGAHIFLHGAHVTHYQPVDHEPILWMSNQSSFNESSPIRGGIPICWPWFGPHPTDSDLPQHGFARISKWTVRAAFETDEATEVVLGLTSNEVQAQHPGNAFDARFRVSVGEELMVELGVTNTGDQTMSGIGCALHSYFSISDIDNMRIDGLEGMTYFDKLSGERELQSTSLAIDQETDRVYFGNNSPISVVDPGKTRQLNISGQGSGSTVVWNPWIAKAQKMPDFPDLGYKEMVCVETANALDDIRDIEPGESHVVSQRIQPIKKE